MNKCWKCGFLGKTYIVSLHSHSYSVLYCCVTTQSYVSLSSIGFTFMFVNASLQMDTRNCAGTWEVTIDLLECSVFFLSCMLRSSLWGQISAPISWLRLCKRGWHHARGAQVARNWDYVYHFHKTSWNKYRLQSPFILPPTIALGRKEVSFSSLGTMKALRI